MVTARASGERVEDLSQRTETVRVFAEPDGTWTSDGTTEPERVQAEDGSWHDLDTTLIADGGRLAPAAAVGDVEFSAGGDKVFAALTDERGKRLEWRWPTVLPEPTVDGDTAIYPDAVPGVGDLVVIATATGFTHHVVIPERPDGAVDVTIPVATRGAELVENPGGEVAIETPGGDTMVAAARPVMWDSSENPGGDPQVAPVETSIGKTPAGTPTLALSADEGFLADPETVYPVVLDPSFTINPSGDTWVQTPNYTSSQSASDELKVGTYDGGGHKARSFLRFDNGNAKWAGVHVLDAKLKLRNYYSGSCTGATIRVNRILESWTVSGLTWGNQPSVGAMSADFSPAYGYNSNCAGADATWNMTEIVQGWNSGLANNGVRLKAVDETSNFAWRRYRSANYATTSVRPRLIVSYNSYPTKPTTPTLTPGNPGYATSTTPTFTTTVSDPDGGTVRATFEVYQGSTLKWTGTTGYVASGKSVSKAIGSGFLTNGTTYTVKVKANDGTDNSKAYSTSTNFTVDTAKPTVSVSSTGFTNNQWRTEAPSTNTFTFTGSGDTKSFAYTFDGIAQPAKTADTSGNATVSWLPKNGAHTLTVTPTDKAGNVGASVTFKFGVGPAAFTTPNVAARSTSTFPIHIAGPPNATGATVSWRYADTTTWHTADGITKAGSPWTGTVANTSDGTASATGTLLWDATAQTDPATDTTIGAPALIELRGCFAYTGGASQVCTTARPVQLVPSAFGGNFPVTTLGPATLALFTGEMTLTEPDAVDATAGAGRTFSTYDASTTTEGAFGPGWSTGLFAAGDTTDLVDHRELDGTLVLVTTGNASQTFTPTGAPEGGKTTFVRAEGDDGSRLVVDTTNTPTTATLTRPQGTVTTWNLDASGASPAWVLDTAAADPTSGSDPDVEFVFSEPGYPTWIAETEPGASTTCTPATQTAGCRALKISYTGTGTNQRVSKIERIAHSTPAVTLATYTYDAQNRLATVCDPRPNPQLCTSYTYTAVSGRTLLATATPAGQKPWRFGYDTTGRLTTVKRALDSETNTGTGDATWTAVYDLPTGTSGLPSMTDSAVTEWGQETAPTRAYAVFSPVKVPANSTPTSSELPYASLWYTDDQGTTTNTAAYGAGDWLVDTRWYDDHGNVVRQLDGAGRARALEAPAAGRPAAAYDASALTFYNTGDSDTLDARRVEDVYGPVRTATLRDGTTGPFRAHSSFTYDDEDTSLGGGSKPSLPDGRPAFDLVVETTHTAAGADLVGDHDPTTARNTYDPIVTGDGNGWTLGTPTRTQTKLADGTWSTRVNRYDTRGREIETRQPGGATTPGGSGADAHATLTTYYAPGAADGECNTTSLSKPAWAGLVCKTKPAAQPTDNPMPTTYQADYDSDLRPTRVEERSGTTTRVTTTAYDALGRPTTQTITIGGTSRATSTGYDPANGLPVTESSSGSTVTTQYDTWGRVWKYTDATGLVATSTYTPDGQLATQSDGLGTYTYTYDSSSERRRLPTSISLGGGVTDAFTLTYDATGAPDTVTYPHGLKASYAYDETGTPTGLDYTTPDGTDLLSFSNTLDVDGRVLSAASAASEQDYTYDNLGRLTKVEDNRTDGCTTRTYGFAPASERTSLKAYAPTTDGACQTTTPTVTRTSSYDTANRIRNDGYTYDDLGRTLTIPATDTGPGAAGPLTATYHVNDMVKSLTQTVDDGNGGTHTSETSYTLDPGGRINTVTNKAAGTETDRLRYRFTDTTDSPTSIQTSTDAGANWTTTRYLGAPALGMAGSVTNGTVTWQLANLHGDVVATQTSAGGIDSYNETDEYGNAIETPSPTRYGWLGTHQRSTDTTGGLVLMGARLYNPTTGIFLSNDPIQDGGANRYSYPTDPINQLDLTGEAWCPSWCKARVVDGLAWAVGDLLKISCYGIAAAAYLLCRGSVSAVVAAAKYFIKETWAYGRSVTGTLLANTAIAGAKGFLAGVAIGQFRPGASAIASSLQKYGLKAATFLRGKGFTRFGDWLYSIMSRIPTYIRTH